MSLVGLGRDVREQLCVVGLLKTGDAAAEYGVCQPARLANLLVQDAMYALNTAPSARSVSLAGARGQVSQMWVCAVF